MLQKYHIGTSGWSYKHWKGQFYPEGLKAAEYLKFYAAHFGVSELNTSFYHLPLAQTALNWASAVPANFKFCPKLSRSITHYQKLLNSENSLKLFFEVFDPIRKKLGPVLVQLPHFVKFHPEKTENFYKVLRSTYKQHRFALEAREAGWFSRESLDLMKRYHIALVISQSERRFPFFEAITAKDIYYRFHGPAGLYASDYTDTMLRNYASKFTEWIADKHHIWAFFNNDIGGYAYKNAMTLNGMMLNKSGISRENPS
ncbi:MAG: DUF72 domain-containing protein [Chitinophagales bacterium]|nr:DUF72 domain-containing protein [Chitinophagales bacterium]